MSGQLMDAWPRPLHAELDELFDAQNTSASDGATVIPATCLRVTVAL